MAVAFCIGCGQQLVDGAKFCANCGTQAAQTNSASGAVRQTVYAGEIHKCPNCGEVLNSFSITCPTCGYELRGAKATSAVREFSLSLEKAATEQQRINLIRAFPIPNTKEEIIEFMLLATSNFDVIDNTDPSASHLEIFNAWFSKIELCYQKAKMVMISDSDFPKIQDIYDRVSKKADGVKKVLSNKEQEKHAEVFKKGKFSKVLLVFTGVFLLMCIYCFSNREIIAGLIAMAQAVLFAVSWLMGMQFIKKKVKNVHIIVAIAGFALIIPFAFSNSLARPIKPQYTWPNSELSRLLPQPKTNIDNIYTDSDSSLYVRMANTSREQFDEYIENCKKKGFTIDSSKGSITYEAYNENGHELKLMYYQSGNLLDIQLEAPIEMKAFQWPKSKIANLLPVPESLMGSISWENEKGFVIYVGKTQKDQYNAYVDACWERGFKIDYRKGDDFFWADNKDGFHVSIKYEGFDIMWIRVDAPKN